VRVGLQRRSAVIAVFAVVATLVVVALPIKWHNVQWGTVPEWIGVVALLLIGGGVWSLARSIERVRDRSDHFR
jgi:hypothetical protein